MWANIQSYKVPNVTAARNVFTSDYLNRVGRIEKQQGLTMGETQSAFYEDHEPAPYITAEMPQEVSRNKNSPAYTYQSMVPSMPLYPEQDATEESTIDENIVVEEVDNEITVENYTGSKTIFLAIVVFLMIFYSMRRRNL